MNSLEALQQHQSLCDDLHALTLEENRHLQQHRTAPTGELLERKRALLARLDETLAALRTAPRDTAQSPTFRAALDKTRARILQILQLDKENEQLLLRVSLSGSRTASVNSSVPAGMLQKIYQRHS
jgi:flagellar biosynthesis/type III secretory pathway chaperone